MTSVYLIPCTARKESIYIVFLLFIGLVFSEVLIAGTTVIEVRTEGWGTIKKSTGETNQNGAMAWNGKEWMVNNTWAHMYFWDKKTDTRIKVPEVIPINAGSEQEFDTLNFHIKQTNYNYSYPAKNNGSYLYNAVRYAIKDKTSNKQIVLNSRGTGNGTGKAYFDIYFENEDSVGKPQTISALRNDPKWFIYTNVLMDQVLSIIDTIQHLTGNLPTQNAWYFLDFNGGADMGGKSFHFHTGALMPDSVRTADMKSSYPIDFALRWMDASGNLKELRFLPKLTSETYTPPVFPPTVTTDSITNILAPSAKIWGYVTSDGGGAIIERGFVYASVSSPTIETATKVTAGTSTGTFTASLANLAYDQVYHVRAYAVNSKGISYGADKSFRTLKGNVLLIATEGKGTVIKSGGLTNPFGAMISNAQEWVVNTTWAHKYFLSSITGERLKQVEATAIPGGTANWSLDTLNYKITRQSFTYSYPAKEKGTYTYQAIQFSVQNKITGKQVVLRSRGTGNGTAGAFFDIYIEDDLTTGIPPAITAIRNDPKWYTYTDKTIEQAIAQTSATENLTGEFPTSGGWYFLDINNGADMGGKSYHFHTAIQGAIHAKTADLGSSYAIDFALRWTDGNGNIKEFQFLPKLVSEAWTPPVGIEDESMVGFSLTNYPNPFDSQTVIRYELPEPVFIRLSVYDSMGRELSLIDEGLRQAGNFNVIFPASRLTLKPGIYFYMLQAGDRILCKKMIYK